jgi:hypothetical protein
MVISSLQAAQDVLSRAEALLTLDPGTENVSLLQYDIRRQAVAMGVAALDTWMHWSVQSTNLNALSSRLHNLDVPFGALVAMGNDSLSARRRDVRDRPIVRARNVLNEKLLTMTFQTAKQWELGFDLLGIRQGIKKTGLAMTPNQTHATVTAKLNELSHRRNKIVHEGDLRRLVRPRTVTRSQLLRSDVDADIAWIGSFLIAVDTVA